MDAPTSPWSLATEARGPRTGRLVCREAATAEELAAHFAVRHQVFVVEQGIFAVEDRDVHDVGPGVVHVVGLADGLVTGAVRLYPVQEDGGRWQGDRLAVLSAYRHLGLGAPLVRFAVRTAGLRGGREMLAHIQLGNVRFFQRLGWRPVGGPEEYAGLPHQRMVIPLSAEHSGDW